MGRWEPDAAGRLRAAAMELFVERGYDQVTVGDIADRAGVTSRTFFRYFGDKREVLFPGSGAFEGRVLEVLHAAPAGAPPLAAVAVALAATADVLPPRAYAAQRWRVVASHPELRERELIKLAALATALADGLRERGVPPVEADLAAETGMAVYRVAFHQWVTGPDDTGLATAVRTAFAGLRALATS